MNTKNGELIILDKTGDTKLIWNADNADEVNAAREMFNSLKKKGFSAYAIEGRGEKGELIRDFDPAIERIIMSPRMVGG